MFRLSVTGIIWFWTFLWFGDTLVFLHVYIPSYLYCFVTCSQCIFLNKLYSVLHVIPFNWLFLFIILYLMQMLHNHPILRARNIYSLNFIIVILILNEHKQCCKVWTATQMFVLHNKNQCLIPSWASHRYSSLWGVIQMSTTMIQTKLLLIHQFCWTFKYTSWTEKSMRGWFTKTKANADAAEAQ